MTPAATKPRRATYTTYLIHTIMPAPGWQGVWWIEEEHESLPIYALALVTCQAREVSTNQVVHAYADELEEDRRLIVGMDYNPSDGWNVCEEDGNYCGLLPPGWTLADFEQHHNPATAHTKKEAR